MLLPLDYLIRDERGILKHGNGASLMQCQALTGCFMLLILGFQQDLIMNKHIRMLEKMDVTNIFSFERHLYQGE